MTLPTKLALGLLTILLLSAFLPCRSVAPASMQPPDGGSADGFGTSPN